MSTQLATQDAVNPLAYLGISEGEPLKPVRLDLIQPINASPEDGTIAGRFLDAQSNSQFEQINVVVLEMRDGRVCFESQELGSKPICRSQDGVQPVISDDLQRQDYGKGCAKCPMSQWKKVGGRSIKPQCSDTKSTLVAELETGFPYRLNAKGMGVTVYKDLKATIAKFYLTSKAKGMAILPTQMFFTLSSVKVKGQKGTYYVPKFSPPQPIQDEQQMLDIANIHERLVVNRAVDYGDGPESTEDPGRDPVAEVLAPVYEAA